MPVVVTGGDHVLARRVVAALLARDARHEVRVTVRERPHREWYADSGVPVAVSDLSDPLTTGAILEGAHTVVHLERPRETWQWLLEAAEGTSVRRIVVVDRDPATFPTAAYGLEVVALAGDPAAPDDDVVEAVLQADARA